MSTPASPSAVGGVGGLRLRSSKRSMRFWTVDFQPAEKVRYVNRQLSTISVLFQEHSVITFPRKEACLICEQELRESDFFPYCIMVA